MRRRTCQRLAATALLAGLLAWPGCGSPPPPAAPPPTAEASGSEPFEKTLAVRPLPGRRFVAAAGRRCHPLRSELAALHRLRDEISLREAARGDSRDLQRPRRVRLPRRHGDRQDLRLPARRARAVEGTATDRDPHPQARGGRMGRPSLPLERGPDRRHARGRRRHASTSGGSTPTASRGRTTTSSPIPTSARDATRRETPSRPSARRPAISTAISPTPRGPRTSSSTGAARGLWSALPPPPRPPGSRSGTIPRAAVSRPGHAPGSRSTVLTATIPKAPRGTRGSTCWPRRPTPRPTASSSRRSRRAAARAGASSTSSPGSPTGRSSSIGSTRRTPAS